jgi:hypothetical protein
VIIEEIWWPQPKAGATKWPKNAYTQRYFNFYFEGENEEKTYQSALAEDLQPKADVQKK